MKYDIDGLNHLFQINEEEYLKTIKKLIKENKENHRAIYQLANHLFYNMYFEQAKKYLRTLLNTRVSILAHYKLGEIEKFMGNFDKARMHFNKSLQQNCNEIVLNNLANMEFFLGNNEAAKDAYYQSFTNQKNPHALNYLGKVFLSDKDYQIAEEIFNNYLNKYDKIIGYMNFVSLYIKKQDYEKADYYLKKIIFDTNVDETEETYLNNVNSYLNYMLHKKAQKPNSYFEQQLQNYNLEDLSTHLKKHTNSKMIQEASIFSEEIDIQKVIGYASEQIRDKKIYLSNSADSYIISFDKTIGKDFGQKTKKAKVITIANTDKILTIFPIIASDKLRTRKFFESNERKRQK